MRGTVLMPSRSRTQPHAHAVHSAQYVQVTVQQAAGTTYLATRQPCMWHGSPCRGMLRLSGVLACRLLSRMRSLPTIFTLPLNIVSSGAPMRLRPPAWSSRANRAWHGPGGRLDGQTDKHTVGRHHVTMTQAPLCQPAPGQHCTPMEAVMVGPWHCRTGAKKSRCWDIQ